VLTCFSAGGSFSALTDNMKFYPAFCRRNEIWNMKYTIHRNLPPMLAHLLWSLPSGVLTCFSAGGRGPYILLCTLGIPRIITYFQIHYILTNKAKVKYAKINLSSFATSKYENSDNWLFRQTKPKQTQLKPKQTQFKPNLTKGQN